MISVSNLKTYEGIPFEEYLRMPGYSYSSVKNEGVAFAAPTARMNLGTDVHNYILTPAEYKHKNIEIVKPLALATKQVLGPLLKYLKPELAITADFEHEGFTMPYKGRVDLSVPGRLVIDLKVTEKLNLTYFGYPDQLSGYCLGLFARTSIIITINPKTKKTQVHNIPINLAWWAEQVKKRGYVRTGS